MAIGLGRAVTEAEVGIRYHALLPHPQPSVPWIDMMETDGE